jgi:hypothetical protein
MINVKDFTFEKFSTKYLQGPSEHAVDICRAKRRKPAKLK